MDAASLGWMNMIRAIQQQEIDHWRYNNPHTTLPDNMKRPREILYLFFNHI